MLIDDAGASATRGAQPNDIHLGDTRSYYRYYDYNKHGNAAYESYKKRARFPGITENLLRAMMGIATTFDSSWELPDYMEYLEDYATKKGKDLQCSYEWLLSETLQLGRSFILIDICPTSGLPYMSLYEAESVINWECNVVDGTEVITVIEIEEIVTDPSAPPLSRETVRLHRILKLDNGIYTHDIYIDGNLSETKVPNYQGRPIGFIPIVPIGSNNIDIEPDPIPMLPIAETALQIYMKDADLSQAEFLSCNPTLVQTGVDDDSTTKVVGATVGISIPNPEAKVYYPETDTSALEHVRSHIKELYEEAVSYGSSILGASKKAAESAEALRMRHTASAATLSIIVDNVGSGVEMALRMIAIWMGYDEDINDIEFNPNKQFSRQIMTANEQQALLQARLAGEISQDTYLKNMKRASIIPADVSVEEEKILIEQSPPPGAHQGMNGVVRGEDTRVGSNSGALMNPSKLVGNDRNQEEVASGSQDT
jgi:hypothetical protein